MKLKKNILLLLCFTIAVSSKAQEGTSLPQMINEALDANYDIRIVRNEEIQAAKTNSWGNAGMLPNANVLAEKAWTINNSQQVFVTGDTQSADAAQNEGTFAQLAVNWVIFDGLAMFARKDRLAQLEALSKSNTRYFMEQTAADLAMAYYQLKQEHQLLAAYRKTLEVSGARFELQQKELEVGAGTGLDVQRAEVDRNTDSSMVLTQIALIQELEVEINRLMNRDLETPVKPVDDFNLDTDLNFSKLLSKALNENTQLTQQQIREIIAGEVVDINRGALFPEVELFGNYNYNKQLNEVGFLQSSRSRGPEFGVRVRFNLFSGGQQLTTLQNSKIEAVNESLRTEQTKQEINAALRIAYLRWESEIQQLLLEESSSTTALQTLEIAKEQYRLGAINDVDFRFIQLSTLNAETRLLQARYRAKAREIELYRLSGELMERLMGGS